MRSKVCSVASFVGVEPLERRQLLHGGVADFHIQFGPKRVTPAEAYAVDSGQTFSTPREGTDLSFGWTQRRAGKPVARRDTPLSPDSRYDSFVAVKRGASWEMAVPNGAYAVHLVAGDGKAKKGTYGFDVEGVPALRGNANATQRWLESTVTVDVSDGLLTVFSPPEFKRNRLNFIDVAPAGAGSVTSPSPPIGVPNAEGFIPLFNGSDLSNFYTFIFGQGVRNDPRSLFKVEDGMIHVLGIPETPSEQPFGYLATQSPFADYHLRVQYKWGENKFPPRDGDDTPRDSGVLFHVNGHDTVWPLSVEAQIQEHDTGDVWLLGPVSATTSVESESDDPVRYQAGGESKTVTDGRIVKSDTVDSLTDWNTVEVIAEGDAAVVIVNGEVVNRVSRIRDQAGNPIRAGRIALQLEGAEVWYRNVELKPLTSYGSGAAPPADSGAVTLLGGAEPPRFVQRDGGAPLAWDVEDGVMTVRAGAGDVRSTDSFTDYRLHLEFQVPVTADDVEEQGRGNSGVGLAGSYELQILDSFGRAHSDMNDLGAIYGVADAGVNAALPAGVWQTYDITFTAPRFDTSSIKAANARIKAYLNGVLIHDDVEVPVATFTFDPESPGPRPLVLQDHANPVRFRNIWVDPI